MSDNPPPAYRWKVSLSDGLPFPVDAAYPVIEDGHLLLKDPAHKIVFAAAPGTGCTFTRAGLADAAPGPISVTGGFPDNCACTYTATWNSGVMTGRWLRNINWACKADHAEVDRLAVVAADSDSDADADNPPPGTGFWPCACPAEGAKVEAQVAPGSCPHGFPPTVRCHECSPVTAPGAQAEGDGTRL